MLCNSPQAPSYNICCKYRCPKHNKIKAKIPAESFNSEWVDGQHALSCFDVVFFLDNVIFILEISINLQNVCFERFSFSTCRGNNSAGERRGKVAGGPKVSVSPDFKRPAFNPALYSGADGTPRGGNTARQTPVRHSRRSLREIKPQENARKSKSSEV
jgi:hypothetical protein